MKAFAVLVLSLCMATNLVLATEQLAGADDEPVFVWERGKDGDNPLAALAGIANLPRGTPGQAREELREQLLEAGARIISEDEHRIVVRGKTNDGVELNVDFHYNFENGVFVPGSGSATGSRIE